MILRHPPDIPNLPELSAWLRELHYLVHNIDGDNTRDDFTLPYESIDGGNGALLPRQEDNDARYLQLTGGTLTGSLSGTTGTFSGAVTASEFEGDVAGASGVFSGNVTSGTFTAVSTTLATNVNADLLDNYEGAEYARYAGDGTFSGTNTVNGSFNVPTTIYGSLYASDGAEGNSVALSFQGIYDGVGTYTYTLTFSGGIFTAWSTSV